ncbi:hypothetical protein QBC47DRAFT_393585 [Echria macrotheca]|uniref:ABM domain-containing protein n=1 Tax=Echria macrotheca TaxID=438768 RepID=A0AAJ0B507_9PEZI|nr:hypothetical protein QBC47DRAFT_393585 [Echria macrotheca]
MPIHVVAFLYPKPDKVARVEELAQSVSDYVKENEPGVLKYQWFRAKGTDKPTIVVWESYADQAAIETHKAGPKLAWLQEVSMKEDIMAAPLKVIPLEQFTGFESRL